MAARSLITYGAMLAALEAGTGGSAPAAPQADTTKIAFSASNDSGTQIYLVNADGTGLQRLTSGPGNSMAPAFSRDGQTLAFISDRDGRSAIYTMSRSGAEVRRIVTPAGQPRDVTWAPDGQSLAYDEVVQRTDYIEIVGLDGGPPRRLVEGFSPDWAPDGVRIAFSGGGQFPQVMVVDRDGKHAGLLLKRRADGASVDLGPLWSPDGSTIVYASIALRSGSRKPAVYVQRLDEERTTALPDGLPCAWSPEGTRIALIAPSGGKLGLSVVNADGSGLRRVVDLPGTPPRGGQPECSWAR